MHRLPPSLLLSALCLSCSGPPATLAPLAPEPEQPDEPEPPAEPEAPVADADAPPADPTPAAQPSPERFAPLWQVETGDWNHGILVLDSGDVISQSMWRMRVHARHDGAVLRTAKTCGALRSSAFVQTAPDKAMLVCREQLREYSLPDLAAAVSLTWPFDADEATVGGGRVAISSREDEVVVFDLASGAELTRFKAGDEVEALALSPDGASLALGLDDRGVELRELASGATRVLVPNDSAEPNIFRNDGAEIMGEVDSFTVGAIEVPSGRILRSYEVSSWITTTRYIDATSVLAAGAHGASILHGDGSQTELDSTTAEGAGVSPDGRTLCWGDRDGTISCWSKDKPAPSTLAADQLAPSSGTASGSPSSTGSGSTSPAAARELDGTLTRKLGRDELLVTLSGGPKPAVGTTGELSKAFSQTLGNAQLSGWMVIAEVEVTRVTGDEIRLKITKHSGEMTVNGKRVDHYVAGTKVRLTWP